jgi:hypothetical protein
LAAEIFLGDAPAFRQDSGQNPCAQAMGGKRRGSWNF